MHYIRLLRPPVVEQTRSPPTVRLVIAITTDLGDAFLSPREPLELCILAAHHGEDDGRHTIPINLTQRAPPKWKAGMRVLKLNVPLPRQPVSTLQIRPLSRPLSALSTTDITAARHGLVLPVYVDLPSAGREPAHVAFRSVRLAAPLFPSGGDLSTAGAATAGPLQVEEEIGESIARHVWDAGLLGVALLADLCFSNSTTSTRNSIINSASGGDGGGGGNGNGNETTIVTTTTELVAAMPRLRGILRRKRTLNVLELGCGVGVLGCGLAHLLNAPQGGRDDAPARVLLTDLPEAEARARQNMARVERLLEEEGGGVKLQYENLDWEAGREGRFGEAAAARPWDLVVLSDCVYNNDMLPPLVQTLTAVHAVSSGLAERKDPDFATKVFLIQKPRHHSEKVLFDLMEAEGWAIEERITMPLPVLDSEEQGVEAYLFARQ